MNDLQATAPRPSAADIRKLLETELSSRARITYTLLLLVDLAMGAVVASLWMTEPDLPARTHAAFALLVLVSLGWAVFFAWTLTRRTLFLPAHRVGSARLAVAGTSLFMAGALLLGIVDAEVRSTALSAATLGGVMLAVALTLLIRARQRLRALLTRRNQLATLP